MFQMVSTYVYHNLSVSIVKLDQLGLFWLQKVAAKFAGTKAVTIGAFVGPYVVYYSRKVEIFKTTMLLPCLVVAVL